MTTYNWSALTNGQSLAFDPNVDVLRFDDSRISAASLDTSWSFGGSITILVLGKTFVLQADIRTLTTTNVTFADGSIWRVGDNTTGIANDGGSNTVTGGSGADRLYGLGGNDTISAGAGNDYISLTPEGAFGNDTVDGGSGSDTLSYGRGEAATPATVNLATHSATNGGGNTTFTSIETVFATVLNDTLIGGDPAHGPDAQGNTTSERFRGREGSDSITGGAGIGFFTTSDYSDNNSSEAATVNLFTGVAQDGTGGTDTLANIDAAWGGAGNDTLVGGSLSRSVSGGFFESFRGNAGNDTLDGGNAHSDGDDASSDRADYANNSSTQAINVDLGTGTVQDGLGGTDTLIDISQVNGGAGNDTFTGGAGDDDFDGGRGNDTLDGGAGSDTANFQQSNAGVIVNLSATSITVNSVTVAAGTANDGMGGTDTLISMESVRGSDSPDYIRGSDDVNVRQFFRGDAGDDTIDGGAGIDFASYSSVALVLGGLNAFIENGSGTVIDRQGGTDTLINIEGLSGTNSNDTLTGGLGDQWFRGRGGSDTMDGGAGSDWVLYNDPAGVTIDLAAGTATDGWNGLTGLLALGGTDTLISIENAEASDHADSVTGSSVANELRGRAGDDVLTGGAGGDILNGGAGFDTAAYDTAGAAVVANLSGATGNTGDAAGDSYVSIEALRGSAFDDTLVGDNNANSLFGLAANDVLQGRGGNDALEGADGNDQLEGGEGADALAGGTGFDYARYVYAAPVVAASAGPSALAADNPGITADLSNALANTGEAAGDIYTSIEGLIGSQFDDNLSGDANANDLVGGDGNDRIDGRAGNDNLQGGNGDDHLLGGADADVLKGGDGSDTARYDTSTAGVVASLIGYSGVTGDAVGDVYISVENLSGTNTHDTLIGDGTANTLSGLLGNDYLQGRDGGDVLLGGDGNDQLEGGTGGDTLNGGAGMDYAKYTYAAGAVTVDLQGVVAGSGEAAGDSFISVEGVIGSAGGDTLYGDSAANDLAGGAGNDTVDARGGDDNVQGGAGNDALDGGAGVDRLRGGDGDDTFNFTAGQAQGDAVLDFEAGILAGDLLVFHGYGLGTFTQVDSTHWTINSQDGTVHETITLANAPSVLATDYQFSLI